MHYVELRATINKGGKLYARSKGVEYPGLDDGQFAFVSSKAAEVAMHVQAMKSGHGDFEVVLEGDADGNPMPTITKSGLSQGQVLDIEDHMADIQKDMISLTRRLLKAAGKL